MVRFPHSFFDNSLTHHAEDFMKKLATLAAFAAIMTTAVPAAVIAQGTTQTINSVDVHSLGTGVRSSKVVGSSVVNENKDTIGKIDDLIVTRGGNHKVYA